MARQEPTLWDYWRIVRRRRGTIAASCVAVLISTYLFSRRQVPIYAASAMVKVERRSSSKAFLSDWVIWGTADYLGTEAEIIRSWPLLREAAIRLGRIVPEAPAPQAESQVMRLFDRIHVEKTGYTNILRISYSGPDPAECALVVNAVAEVYRDRSLEERGRAEVSRRANLKQQMEEAERGLVRTETALKDFEERSRAAGIREKLVDQLAALRLERARLARQYQPQHPRLQKLDSDIADLDEQVKGLPREDLQRAKLKREANLASEVYSMLSLRFKEASLSQGDEVATISIISPATVPTAPVAPNARLNFLIGGVMGLLLGFAVALLVEHLDTSISDIEEVEEFLKLPVIGLVPHLESGKSPLVTLTDAKSPGAEAYRTLLINLKFALPRDQVIRLLVTSTGPDEGKSVTAANLAIVSALAGRRTVLVETDLRRPTLARLFGVERSPGLTEVLIGESPLAAAMRPVSDLPLHLIPSGYIPRHPLNLLQGEDFLKLLKMVQAEHDVVILDSPPVLPVADALVLTGHTDGVVLVYKVGATARGALRRARFALEGARAPVLGVVLNDIRAAVGADYDFLSYYRYYGRHRKEPAAGAGWLEAARHRLAGLFRR